MSVEISILLCIALIITSVTSLLSKTVSLSLILLFYSSVVLNIIFTIYGAAIIALIHLVIFAGAISVMLLVTIVITGEANLSIGNIKNYVLIIIFIIALSVFLGLNIARELRASSGIPLNGELLEFVWTYRPWDLLILIIILAASMVTALNLLSRTREE